MILNTIFTLFDQSGDVQGAPLRQCISLNPGQFHGQTQSQAKEYCIAD